MCCQGLAWTRPHRKGVRYRPISICSKQFDKREAFFWQSSTVMMKNLASTDSQAGFMISARFLRLSVWRHGLGQPPASFTPLQRFYGYPGIDLESTLIFQDQHAWQNRLPRLALVLRGHAQSDSTTLRELMSRRTWSSVWPSLHDWCVPPPTPSSFASQRVAACKRPNTRLSLRLIHSKFNGGKES